MKNIFMCLAISLFFCLNALAKDSSVVVDVKLSPAGSFEAKSKKVSGKVVKQGGKLVADKLKVSIKSIKTGIEMRDEHLYKRLESDKESKIEILEAIGSGGKGQGKIKIRGITKDFNFTYSENGSSVTAKFKLNLKDFKIPDLSYMSVGVEDEVNITAVVPLK